MYTRQGSRDPQKTERALLNPGSSKQASRRAGVPTKSDAAKRARKASTASLWPQGYQMARLPHGDLIRDSGFMRPLTPKHSVSAYHGPPWTLPAIPANQRREHRIRDTAPACPSLRSSGRPRDGHKALDRLRCLAQRPLGSTVRKKRTIAGPQGVPRKSRAARCEVSESTRGP